MNTIRIEALIKYDVYDSIDNYFNENINNFPKIEYELKHKGYKLKLNFCSLNSLEKRTVKITYTIYKNDIELCFDWFKIEAVEKLIIVVKKELISEDTLFLISFNKKYINTMECFLENWRYLYSNNKNMEYVKNYFMYADLSNQTELLRVCCLILANNKEIDNDSEFKSAICDKFHYYGYLENENFNNDNINNVLNGINVNSEQIIKFMIEKTFSKLSYYDKYKTDKNISLNYIGYYAYKNYINCLYEEKTIF